MARRASTTIASITLSLAILGCFAPPVDAQKYYEVTGFTPSPHVLTYVPAHKHQKAYVVFVAPHRDLQKPQTFRLRTKQGTVTVLCDPTHPGNPPLTWASEISYPLNESLFHFRSPRSLPIHINYEGVWSYGGNSGGSNVHQVKVNGKIRDTDPPNGRPQTIVMTGTRNTLALIICDSGGE